MPRDKPVLRAIKLLSLIERHPGGLRVTDMAEQLGTPLRAVYRDLEVLQELPVPLFTDRNGKESYWKLDPDYRSKLTVPFTLSELLSLYLAQDSLRPLDGTLFSGSLQSLFEKLWAVLPKVLFREMVSLRGSFLSGLPAQKEYRTYQESIEIMHSVIQARRTLRLQYEPLNKEPTDRTVDPYAVHLRNGNLYLIGYCHMRKGIRTFLVDRMKRIKLTEEKFAPPLDFSLEKYLRHSFGLFTEDVVAVKMRFHNR